MPEYHKSLTERKRERAPFEPGDRVEIVFPDSDDTTNGTVENVVGDNLDEPFEDPRQAWLIDVRTDGGVLVPTRSHHLNRLVEHGERDGGP